MSNGLRVGTFEQRRCECRARDCAPHAIVLGKMCCACELGEHRAEGDIGTKTYEGSGAP